MTYNYKVFYFDDERHDWKNGENYKLIKAKSKNQAMEKFKNKYPQYKPYLAR